MGFPAAGMNYSVDVSTNVDVYGMEFTPEAVLGGQFRPPSEMNELYSTLEKVGRGTAGLFSIFGIRSERNPAPLLGFEGILVKP